MDLSYYDTAPRGLTSNNGFEEEDRARAEKRAEIALQHCYRKLIRDAEELGVHLWRQDKFRQLRNEPDALKYLVDDIRTTVMEHAKDGVFEAKADV